MDNNKAIGIDIGGTNLRVALVSEEGKILRKMEHPSTGDVVKKITDSVGVLIDEDTIGIGIAAAGLIDRISGTVYLSPNLPAIEGINFGERLGEKYSVPVGLENDANLAALGEKYIGKGKDLNSFVLMTLGTGIGGGIIYNGELMNIPAEIGHLTVEPAGVQCVCGNRGCVEEYAAAKAMIHMATSALEKGKESSLRSCCKGNIYKITPRIIYENALEGDGLARDILKTAGGYLGIAISHLANIFRPEAFILSGGLADAWDIYIEAAVREAERRALKGLFRKDMVMRSGIKEGAGIIGAAFYAFKAFYAR